MPLEIDEEIEKLARMRAAAEMEQPGQVYVPPVPQGVATADAGYEMPDIAGPVRKPLAAPTDPAAHDARYRLLAGDVPNNGLARQAAIDLEEQGAADYDRESRRINNFQSGIANAVGTISGTRAPPPNELHSKLAEVLARRKRADDALHQTQQIDLADRGLKQTGEIARARTTFDKEKEKQDQANFERQRTEAERHNKEMERAALAAAGLASRKEERTVAKEARDVAKDTREQQEGLAFGWEKMPGSNATSKQMSEHATLVSSAEKMKGLAQQMRTLLKDNGGSIKRFVPGSDAYNSMNQLATMIGIEGKNIAELGALSGPDYALMQAVAANPTSIFTAGRDMNEVLTRLENWGENSVQSKSKAIGVRRKSGDGGGEANNTPEATFKVRRKRDGQTRDIAFSQMAAFENNPDYEVVPP